MQSKIRKVHVAAREGSLRDLQAALDRRKFSTAKDEISPKSKKRASIIVKWSRNKSFDYLLIR